MSTQHQIPSTFKAYAHRKTGHPEVLEIIDFPLKHPTGSDLLIKVYGAATNPIDGKIRNGELDKEGPVNPPRILGYDGSGIVVSIGDQVHRFKIGDEVFFAGNIFLTGCNAEYVTIDERIVGRKPKSLSWEQAATVPLCALTTWEPLVESAHFKPHYLTGGENPNAKKSILIIGGAGGVGSMAIQLAKKIFQFGSVIATASRPDTQHWCKKLGADYVIGHSKLKEELISKFGQNQVDVVFVAVDIYTVFEAAIDVIKPCGIIIGITGFHENINMNLAFQKRVTVIPEFMTCRPLFNEEPEKQGEILNTFSELLDKGVISHTMNHEFEWSQLREAQAFQDSGKAIGKIGLKVKFFLLR